MSKVPKKGTKQGIARQATTNPPSPADDERKAAKPRKGRKK